MKRFLTSLTLCTVALSGLALTTYAEDPVEGNNAPSKADIKFTSGGTSVVPTPDPNPDPNEDKDPDADPDLDQEGALRFTTVPNISFGEQALIAQKQNYYANYMSKKYEGAAADKSGKYPTYFTVEDVRGGAKGWKVTVKHNGKFKSKTSEINATLWLKDPNMVSGTFKPEELATNGQTPELLTKPTAPSEYFNISTGSEVLLVQASANQGYGKWSVGYGSTDAKKQTTGYGLDGNVAVPTTGTPTINAAKKGKNPAVKLEVPAQVINTDGENATYTADLEWTIGNAV